METIKHYHVYIFQLTKAEKVMPQESTNKYDKKSNNILFIFLQKYGIIYIEYLYRVGEEL